MAFVASTLWPKPLLNQDSRDMGQVYAGILFYSLVGPIPSSSGIAYGLKFESPSSSDTWGFGVGIMHDMDQGYSCILLYRFVRNPCRSLLACHPLLWVPTILGAHDTACQT